MRTDSTVGVLQERSPHQEPALQSSMMEMMDVSLLSLVPLLLSSQIPRSLKKQTDNIRESGLSAVCTLQWVGGRVARECKRAAKEWSWILEDSLSVMSRRFMFWRKTGQLGFFSILLYCKLMSSRFFFVSPPSKSHGQHSTDHYGLMLHRWRWGVHEDV